MQPLYEVGLYHTGNVFHYSIGLCVDLFSELLPRYFVSWRVDRIKDVRAHCDDVDEQ